MSPLASHSPPLFQGAVHDVNLLIEHDTPNRRCLFISVVSATYENGDERGGGGK